MFRLFAFSSMLGLAVVAALVPTSVLAADVVYRTAAVEEVTNVPEGGELGEVDTSTLDGNRVVLQAYSFDFGPRLDGLWAAEGKQLQTVVTTDTLIPGNVFRFRSFGDFAQDAGATVFVGRYPDSCVSDSCEGIYVHQNGDYRLVVDTFSTVPDRDTNFDRLSRPAIDGEQVAFVALVASDGLDRQTGIYADLGDGLTTVVDWETPVPGESGTFEIDPFDTSLSIENGVVYFPAQNSETREEGFYAWDSSTQTIETLRDGDTLVPGTQRRFDYTWGDMFCGGTYAFIGDAFGASRDAVFVDFGDGLVKALDESDLFADDAPNVRYDLEQLSACGDAIALVAFDDQSASPHLFIYRRTDDSPTLLMQRGSEVGGRMIEDLSIAPRALSGESVSVNVRFLNTYRSGVVVASLHEPGHRMLIARDRNNNGHEEVVLLRQERSASRYVAKVHDAYSGGALWTVPLGGRPVEDFALLDDKPGALRVAVLFEALSGRPTVDYVVASNGNRQKRIQLWQSAEPLALATLADTNGNGASEVAVAGAAKNGVVKIQLRDGRSGNQLAAYPVRGDFELIRLLAVDDAAGATALVLVGQVKSTGRLRALMLDALAGTILFNVAIGNSANSPVLDAAMVDDLDGDGVPELALARTITSNGKSGWQVWNLVGGIKVGARFTNMQVTALHLAPQPDVDGDGTSELSLLRAKPDGMSFVDVDDPVAAASLGRYRMRALEDGVAIAPLAPLDGNATAEFVVLGQHFEAPMLEIHDSGDGTALRYFYLP